MRGIRLTILTVTYILFFFLIILFLKIFVFHDILNPARFLNWDAEWYHLIKNWGYEGRRVAFFPLFPFFWRSLSVGVFGMTTINIAVFASSFIILANELRIKPAEALLYLSIPSFLFFFLPYTEPIFFACCVLIIIGMRKKNLPLMLSGFFLATLSRPAFTVFIPAILITELLTSEINKTFFLRIALYVTVSLLGLSIVGIVQHWYTTEWFTCFSAQKYWDNKLRLPGLPFTSWGGGKIIRLDGTALFFGIFASLILLRQLIKRNKGILTTIPPEVIFSLCYLAGITITVLMFRGGSLFSLNRFFYAVPFIVVATHYWLSRDITFNFSQLFLILIMICAFWLLFASYAHILTFLRYVFLTFYIFMMFLVKAPLNFLRRYPVLIMIILNISFQVFFYVRFLQGGWVG